VPFLKEVLWEHQMARESATARLELVEKELRKKEELLFKRQEQLLELLEFFEWTRNSSRVAP